MQLLKYQIAPTLWILLTLRDLFQTRIQAVNLHIMDYTEDGQIRLPVNRTCTCVTCVTNSAAWEMDMLENVAYGKLARSSSSVYPNLPCAVTDGFYEGSDKTCFIPKANDADPWLNIDLQHVITFKYFVIYRSHSEKDNGMEGKQNIAGVEVALDAVTCYLFGSLAQDYQDLPIKIERSCSTPMTGRYLRIFKKNQVEQSSMVICEVQIWVCKVGYYGDVKTSCLPCNASCELSCNSYFGCQKVFHNMAIMKVATQFPVGNGYFDRPINIDGKYGCTQMDGSGNSSTKMWWRVELDALYKIYSFAITSREDCCAEYLVKNSSMLVLNDTSIPDSYSENQICRSFQNEDFGVRQKKEYSCTRPLVGKYGTLVMMVRGSVGFCQFQLFGHRVYELQTLSYCAQHSEILVCEQFHYCSSYLRCSPMVGGFCAVSSSCYSGAVCGQDGKCRLKINHECDPSIQSQCRPETVCDPSARKCKIRLGDRCQESGQCFRDAVCDRGHCAVKLGDRCTESADCIVGAVCQDGRCTCENFITEARNGSCFAKNKYVKYTGDGFNRTAVLETCKCVQCTTNASAWKNGSLENVAYGKPGTSSSRSYPDIPCAATDGRYEVEELTCFRTTNDDEYPHLQIDLEYVVTFEYIAIYRLQEQTDNDSLGRLSMAGVEISLDGVICYEFGKNVEDYQNLPRMMEVKCVSLMTGRYLRIFKRTKVGNSPLIICEVQIWVCEVGYYGDIKQSCQLCSEDCPHPCNTRFGCQKVLYNVAMMKNVTQHPAGPWNPNFVLHGILFHWNFLTCAFLRGSGGRLSLIWWRVDLEALHKIYNFGITARQDCCAELLLKNMNVLVLNDTSIPESPTESQICKRIQDEKIVLLQRKEYNCTRAMVGRYVTLVLRLTFPTGFCRFDIFGHKVFEVPEGALCLRSSEYMTCQKFYFCNRRFMCEPETGRPCLRDISCNSRLVCDNNKCCYDINHECDTAIVSQCKHGTICDKLSRACKLDIGQPCYHNSTCRSHALCSVRQGAFQTKCRVDMGQAGCEQDDQCTDSNVCDERNKCMIPNGGSCSSSTNMCLLGAECAADNRCHLDVARNHAQAANCHTVHLSWILSLFLLCF